MRFNRLAVARGTLVALCAVFVLASTAPALAANSRFLVTAPHTKEECMKTLDEAKAVGKNFLAKVDWGCMAGDHTAYVILEAKDEAAVREMIPASWSEVRVVKLNKFTPAQIESFHKSMK
jgi:hypothetical protein